MEKEPKKRASRTSSKKSLASEANRLFEEPSTNAYNWHAKYMANVRLNNSKESLLRQKEHGSRIGTSVELPSADSEK